MTRTEKYQELRTQLKNESRIIEGIIEALKGVLDEQGNH